MVKYSVLSLLLVAACFLPNSASALTPTFSKANANISNEIATVQVLKHCKSKQSRCYAYRHHF